MSELHPGDYVGLYLGDNLLYTGVLKDIGVMHSGRKIYQILLVKNIFQRNYPEVHFSDQADVRPVKVDDVKDEIRRLKINLQKNLEKMEPEHVAELVELKEWHSIVG
ncbi:hypothetical protein FBQ81_02715 [Chloroflexi bacterium CFX6]|nr:hypothetical protein [Chloroflexi bacterium CFX6]